MMHTTKAKDDMLKNVVWKIGFFLNNLGDTAQNGNARYTETYISVVPNGKYVLSGHSLNNPLWDRIHGYNSNKEWVQQISKLDWIGNFTSLITIPSGCSYIRISTEIESITQVHMYED